VEPVNELNWDEADIGSLEVQDSFLHNFGLVPVQIRSEPWADYLRGQFCCQACEYNLQGEVTFFCSYGANGSKIDPGLNFVLSGSNYEVSSSDRKMQSRF